MGSMPLHSILRGPARSLFCEGEPVQLHKIFEHVVGELEKINNDNNKTEKYETIHGVSSPFLGTVISKSTLVSMELATPSILEKITLSHEMLQNPALIYRGRSTSFSELNNKANQLARVIAVSICSKSKTKYVNTDGDLIVAVAMPPSDALVVTLLACWKIGAAYLPIDPTFPAARIDHILTESEPSLVITYKKDSDLFKYDRVIDFESLKELAETVESDNLSLEESVAGQDLQTAIILYTSGSTGVPKGVRLSHQVILNRLKWQWETFPYSATEKIGIFKTALTFVDSVSEIWGPLLNARSLLIVPKEDSKDAERIIELLEEYKVERLVLVPTLLQSIILSLPHLKSKVCGKHILGSERPLKNLRLWVCSGEILSPSLAQDFYKHFDLKHHKLCNFYGSTEVMGDVTYHVIDDPEEATAMGKVPIGKPTHNSVIYILDEKLNPVNAGERGEIYVSGGNLATGYVKNRDSHRFIDNNILVDSDHRKLFVTGDFGRIFKNTLYYEGRTDSQIKIRGNRIDLSEIEAALKKIEIIRQSVVLAYNPGEIDQAVLAFVICDGSNGRTDVERQLNNLLPTYMVPVIVVVENIPLLVNGKVDRQFLLNLYRNSSALGSTDLMDFKGVEVKNLNKAKAIFETMLEVLGQSLREKISSSSSFISLGGNSLNAVYFVTKLREIGYAISIKDFLSSPTLAQVIEKVTVDTETIRIADDATTKELQNKYKREQLTKETVADYMEILCTSFHEKADLESYLNPGIEYNDYQTVVTACSKYDLEFGLSFIARNSEGQVVGACMNIDLYKEDMIEVPPTRLGIVLEFLDGVEKEVLEALPKGEGKILHNFMMGSRKGLSVQETIEVFMFMEQELLQLAKSFKFEGVFTTNTSPLTQQLATSVNNYQVLSEHQANLYVNKDGIKPFEAAPDSLTVIVCWKTV